MGLLVDGAWRDVDMRVQDGHFVRKPTAFHNYITADGRAGPTGRDGFPAEAGRYHLYVSLACPWAHRTLIFRKLKKLDAVISVSVTIAHLGNKGWEFGTEPGATPDPSTANPRRRHLYARRSGLQRPRQRARAVGQASGAPSSTTNRRKSSGCSTRRSTPSPMCAGLLSAGAAPEIDAINDVIYDTVNNGVYSAGFATTQAAYEEAAKRPVRHARPARGAAISPALSRRRADHRSRLATIHHAGALRRRLLRPLQMQRAAAHWLYLLGRVHQGTSIPALQSKLTVALRQWILSRPDMIANGGAALVPRMHVVLTPGAAAFNGSRTRREWA